jgi:hypothetical protein
MSRRTRLDNILDFASSSRVSPKSSPKSSPTGCVSCMGTKKKYKEPKEVAKLTTEQIKALTAQMEVEINKVKEQQKKMIENEKLARERLRALRKTQLARKQPKKISEEAAMRQELAEIEFNERLKKLKEGGKGRRKYKKLV